MAKDKRYRAVIAFDVYAESDYLALNELKKLVNKMDKEQDNRAVIVELNEIPFGSLESREVNLKANN